jgi:hypothetical protein
MRHPAQRLALAKLLGRLGLWLLKKVPTEVAPDSEDLPLVGQAGYLGKLGVRNGATAQVAISV